MIRRLSFLLNASIVGWCSSRFLLPFFRLCYLSVVVTYLRRLQSSGSSCSHFLISLQQRQTKNCLTCLFNDSPLLKQFLCWGDFRTYLSRLGIFGFFRALKNLCEALLLFLNIGRHSSVGCLDLSQKLLLVDLRRSFSETLYIHCPLLNSMNHIFSLPHVMTLPALKEASFGMQSASINI